MYKTIYGAGINNANYPINWTEGGKQKRCVIFQRWKAMLSRCYSNKPTSKLPIVCDEWLYFMNFYEWIKDKPYKEYALDKDLLVINNRLYSPETCILVPARTNSLLTDSLAARGNYPLGVRLRSTPHNNTKVFASPFEAYCGFDGKQNFLGVFPDIINAHRAWQQNKIKAIQSEIKYLSSINFEDYRIYPALDLRIKIIQTDLGCGRFTEGL